MKNSMPKNHTSIRKQQQQQQQKKSAKMNRNDPNAKSIPLFDHEDSDSDSDSDETPLWARVKEQGVELLRKKKLAEEEEEAEKKLLGEDIKLNKKPREKKLDVSTNSFIDPNNGLIAHLSNKDFIDRIQYHGPGNELRDLRSLLEKYQYWIRDNYPSYTSIESFLDRMERSDVSKGEIRRVVSGLRDKESDRRHNLLSGIQDIDSNDAMMIEEQEEVLSPSPPLQQLSLIEKIRQNKLQAEEIRKKTLSVAATHNNTATERVEESKAPELWFSESISQEATQIISQSSEPELEP